MPQKVHGLRARLAVTLAAAAGAGLLALVSVGLVVQGLSKWLLPTAPDDLHVGLAGTAVAVVVVLAVRTAWQATAPPPRTLEGVPPGAVSEVEEGLPRR